MKMILFFLISLNLFQLIQCLDQNERDGLRMLQRQFVPDWFGWDGEPSCEWKGVVCDFANHVQRIHLGNLRKSKSTLPYLFDSFPFLTVLDFQNNMLYGTIPVHFERMSNLKYLDLSSNSFSGVIPSHLANLNQLSSLNLSKNQLFGVVPKQFENLKMLKQLSIQENRIRGTIPQALEQSSVSTQLTIFPGNKALEHKNNPDFDKKNAINYDAKPAHSTASAQECRAKRLTKPGIHPNPFLAL